jgi:hypothetical protein
MPLSSPPLFARIAAVSRHTPPPPLRLHAAAHAFRLAPLPCRDIIFFFFRRYADGQTLKARR